MFMDKYELLQKLVSDHWTDELDEHLKSVQEALKKHPTRDVIINFTVTIDAIKSDGWKIQQIYDRLDLEISKKTFSEYLYLGRKKLKLSQEKKPSLLEKLHLIKKVHTRINYQIPTEDNIQDWHALWDHVDIGTERKNRMYMYKRIAEIGITPPEVQSWNLSGHKAKNKICREWVHKRLALHDK